MPRKKGGQRLTDMARRKPKEKVSWRAKTKAAPSKEQGKLMPKGSDLPVSKRAASTGGGRGSTKAGRARTARNTPRGIR